MLKLNSNATIVDKIFSNPTASSGTLTFQKLLDVLEKFLEVMLPVKGNDMIDIPVLIMGNRAGKPVEMYLHWLGCPIELGIDSKDKTVTEFIDTFGYPAASLISMIRALPEEYRQFPAYVCVSEDGDKTEKYLIEDVKASIDTDFPIGEEYTVYLPKIVIRL